jgi:hypothetical protein
MSILSRLFGRPEDASKIIDGAVHGLDKIFFTDEEKADANIKLSDWYLKYLGATSGQNLARRFIALLVVGLWVLLVVLGTTLHLFALGDKAEFVFRVLVDVVMQPFSIIIAFYFLTHTVREYRKGNK